MFPVGGYGIALKYNESKETSESPLPLRAHWGSSQGPGGVAHLESTLPSVPKPWFLSPAPRKPGVTLYAHACNPNTQKVEAGGLEKQSSAAT